MYLLKTKLSKGYDEGTRMKVQKLMTEPNGPWNKLVLPSKAKTDLKKILKFNDENPDKRISSARFTKYLMEEYKIKTRRQTLVSYVKREFGRQGWINK